MQGMKEGLIGFYKGTTALMESFRSEGFVYANRPFLLIFTFVANGLLIYYFNGAWYIWALWIYTHLIFLNALLSYIGEYIYRNTNCGNRPDFNFRTTSEGQDFLIIVYLTLVLVLTGFREGMGAFHSNRPSLLILLYVANGFVFYYFGKISYDWILLLIVFVLYIFVVLSYIGEYIYHKSKEETE